MFRIERRAACMLATVALLVSVGCAAPAQPLPNPPLPTATPAPAIVFPRDADPHADLTEWWYYTGHLSASDGHEYGFEFVIFQVVRANQPTGYLAHYAVSDIGAQRFSHQAQVVVTATPSTDFPLNVGGWQLDHNGTTDTIQAAMTPGPGAEAAYGLSLTLADEKPPVLHSGGYIAYGPAGGSYYYSRPRLAVQGTLTGPDGVAQPVNGIAWMDHQWGNFVISASGGWDWYSLQLDDDTELMLYVLRSASGETTGVYGSHVLADGSVEDLAPGSVSSEPLGTWTSPHTGAQYPSGWSLTLEDGAKLTLQPRLADQELWFPGSPGLMAYWEGAVAVTGDRTGVGYVELTGYADR